MQIKQLVSLSFPCESVQNQETENSVIVSNNLKIKTCLLLSWNDKALTIQSASQLHEVVLDLEQIRNTSIAEFRLENWVYGDDMELLTLLWENLTKLVKLSLTLSTQRNQLCKIFNVRDCSLLKKLHLNISGIPLSDKRMNFSNNIFFWVGIQ